MKITEQEVRRVAELANLALTEDEMVRMTQDMDGILTHIDKLNELDTLERGADGAGLVSMPRRPRRCARIVERKPLGNAEALANAPVTAAGVLQSAPGD